MLGVSCTYSGLAAVSVAQGEARLPGQLDIGVRDQGRLTPGLRSALCYGYHLCFSLSAINAGIRRSMVIAHGGQPHATSAAFNKSHPIKYFRAFATMSNPLDLKE